MSWYLVVQVHPERTTLHISQPAEDTVPGQVIRTVDCAIFSSSNRDRNVLESLDEEFLCLAATLILLGLVPFDGNSRSSCAARGFW